MKRLIFLFLAMMALWSASAAVQTTTAFSETPTAETDSLDVPTVNLDELVITARQDLIKSDGAKLTYNLEEDESSKGQTLLDALRKVPTVTVDGEGNIRINGQSNFKIYVNGREDAMLQSNYQRVFQAMPAESVANIEVITEPGAKYDAEGFGGILNLITESRRPKKDGYSGSVGLSYGNRQAAANGNITARFDKVHMSANAVYADNGPTRQTGDEHRETVYLNDDMYHRNVTDSHQRMKFHFVQADLNMSWEPNARNLFTWGGSYTGVAGKISDASSSTKIFDAQNVLHHAYSSVMGGKIRNEGTSANASYRLAFNDAATHRIIIGYQFNFGNALLDYNMNTSEVKDYPVLLPWQINHTDMFTREHIAQLDYSNPFGNGKHTLDAGLKGIWRHNTALSNGYQAVIPGDAPADNPNDMDTGQNQDVYAAYLSYTGNFNVVSTTAGLRYEHTRMCIDYRRGAGEDFSRSLNDWVPNASVSYILGSAHSLRLAYQMRISRPTLEQVNPFRIVMPDLVMMGNPNLSSERNNMVSLTYTNFGRILGGNIKLQYSQISNGIVQYVYYDGTTQVNTYGNYGQQKTVSLGGFLNVNISQRMNLSLNGEVKYTDMRSCQISDRSSGWGGNYGANWSWIGPWELKFNAYGGQSFHNVNLQGWSGGWYYYGLGIGRDFLSDRSLHVGVSTTNFLSESVSFKSYTRTSDTISNRVYKTENWQVSLSLSWNFGKMKERVKSTGLDIDSDDKSTTRNSSGMSVENNN